MGNPVMPALLLTLTALAGCSDTPENATLTEADCQAQEMALGEVDGEAACVEPPPLATLEVTGLPDGVDQYGTFSFTWVLHTHQNESHAMRTEVRASDASAEVTPDVAPEDYGELLVQFEHQDFVDGQSYDGEHQALTQGTLYLRAYARLIGGQHIWSPEYVVEVGPPQPTGNTVTINISAGVVAAELDPAEATLAVGDALVFQNDDLVDHTFTGDGGTTWEVTAPAGGSSDPIVFLQPGRWDYASDDVEPLEGRLQVNIR